ncbi:Acetyltransferase (GNAT) family protein [Cohaesibacter sp. ES.047]|uniref:GNAT family N-acetyltransferase n=1 Tax=Cohaesibacter sp. ES.047 TaxID=1798205 RepID=UPI000BB91DE8|nr:GNAT family N-acetyltransferase [Cohaesibacter sp. ES.047]SNY93045.1 Acetyltransferase (GNAT) family protein [Cohaesibacter sp. ES.047]
MTLKLRSIDHDDIEAATQCGVAAWLNAMSFTIETLNTHDILRLEQAFRFSFLYHMSGEAACHECLVIADLGGRIVGHCECDCSKGALKNLWVAPNWQGQGIASALLSDARDRLRQAGHDHMRLTALEGNRRALAFYEKEGLVEEERIMQFDPFLQRDLATIILQVPLTAQDQTRHTANAVMAE